MSQNQSPLRTAVGQFLSEHNKWANDQFRHALDGEYVQSLRAVFAELERGNSPPQDRRIEIGALGLATEWLKLEASGESTEPTNDFWFFREQLEKAYHHRDKVLESIGQLHKQGVPEEQIGRMWGLVLADGSGDIELVAREIAMPGSVVRPGDLPLSRLKEQRELDERRDELAAEIEAMGVETIDEPQAEAEAEPKCPETAAQLFWQRVPIGQAAKMLGRTVQEVDELWREFAKEQELREKREQLERLRAELEPSSATSERQPA